MDYKDIERMIADDRLDEALNALDGTITEVSARLDESDHETDLNRQVARLFFLRGKVNWRLDRRGAAITDYERSVALDPDSEAAPALALAREIMDFFNPDLFNP